MNDQDCLGVHRQCSHRDQAVVGRCVCQPGYTQLAQDSVACAKKGDQLGPYVLEMIIIELINHYKLGF